MKQRVVCGGCAPFDYTVQRRRRVEPTEARPFMRLTCCQDVPRMFDHVYDLRSFVVFPFFYYRTWLFFAMAMAMAMAMTVMI